jgi:hypothetical protein
MAEPRDGKPQDEGVLARWSRRKQAARAGEPEEPADSRLPADAQAQAPEVRPEAPATEERADLPDPATLDASSDFKPFLRSGVPVETHRAALRRLWRLDPFYSRHDGLSDYCEDFTDQAATLKGVRTAWRVGRGLLDQIDKAAERRPETASVETVPAEAAEGSREPPTEPAPTEARARPGTKAGRRTRRPLPKRV